MPTKSLIVFNQSSLVGKKSCHVSLVRQPTTFRCGRHIASKGARQFAILNGESAPDSSEEEERKRKRDARRAAQASVGGDSQGNVASRVKMVPLETRENLAGIAGFDKGEVSQDEKLRRTVLLATGDAVCLLLFCAIGRATHGEDVFSPALIVTALPFLIGWFSAAKKLSEYNLGAFTSESVQSTQVGTVAIGAAQNWLLGIPLACLLRSIFQLHIVPVSFTGIAMAVNGVFLIGWRVVAATIIQPSDGTGGGGSRKGGPLEFLNVISRLSTRW
eukprot:CAMPEP_0196571518 /NCGR_PEP_ID=MMETSP1081-20130531/1679_1 /TAXON_ID=36882 /ORGANISM="Pyramimonas amylifera, Strain CCMP720" /LENGTH=273 /DNA_ID=CAMNT_0041888497 /DNA_START=52 /DNA_END=870 /DNA_ORIENTATION=-